MGGLALLAQHLPTIYPEAVKTAASEKPATDLSDSDWIKVEGNKFFYTECFTVIGLFNLLGQLLRYKS